MQTSSTTLKNWQLSTKNKQTPTLQHDNSTSGYICKKMHVYVGLQKPLSIVREALFLTAPNWEYPNVHQRKRRICGCLDTGRPKSHKQSSTHLSEFLLQHRLFENTLSIDLIVVTFSPYNTKGFSKIMEIVSPLPVSYEKDQERVGLRGFIRQAASVHLHALQRVHSCPPGGCRSG